MCDWPEFIKWQLSSPWLSNNLSSEQGTKDGICRLQSEGLNLQFIKQGTRALYSIAYG